MYLLTLSNTKFDFNNDFKYFLILYLYSDLIQIVCFIVIPI